MVDYELIALEVEYSLSHGNKSNAEAGVKLLQWNLSNYLKRYNGISDSAMTDVLRDACRAYGQQRPNKLFITFLGEYIAAYNRKNHIKGSMLSDEELHMETVKSEAYQHNGFHAFNERNFASVPEDLTIAYVDKQTAKTRRRTQGAPSAGFSGIPHNYAMPDDQDGSEAYLEPEELSDGELGPDDQTDDEISNLIDSILGFD